MSPRLRSWGLGVALAVGALAAGCNAILGNDAHELAASGGSTASGTGGTGTSSTGATSSVTTSTGTTSTGTTGTGGSSAGSSMEGGSPDAAGDSAVCTPNAQECQSRTLRRCSGGQWVDVLQCPYACVDGVCAGTCVPGTTQCTLNVPQTCDDKGQWVSGAPCPAICSLGQCTGMCVPGTVQACGSASTCNGNAAQLCDATGTFGNCTPAPSNCLAIPMGWQAVAMTQAGCPQGFGSPQTYFTKATGDPFTCQCGCGGTQKCSGTVTLNEFDPLGGAGCTGTPAKRTLTVSPTCSSGGGSILMPNSYTISDVVYGPGPACASTPKALTMPPVVTESTILCTANGTCPGGACLSLLEGRNLCLSHAGNVACPTDFPTATVMSPTYDDGRSCGACTCGSTLACTLTDVQLNNDSSACSTGHPYWMNANTTCTAAPSSYPLNATKAIGGSTGDGTCAETAPSQPTGLVHLNIANTITVCCR